MEYYDRYKQFRVGDTVKYPLPFFKISETGSDMYIIFDKRTMRLDSLSYKYYGDPNFAWLILNANPGLPMFEYLIENGSSLRIPYPLDSAIQRYEKSIKKYQETHYSNE